MSSSSQALEAARLAALDRYAILDTDPEKSFDDLVELASHVCKAPIAMLCLVDGIRSGSNPKSGWTPRNRRGKFLFARTPLSSPVCLLFPIPWRTRVFGKIRWW